jgi:hypothetical protein
MSAARKGIPKSKETRAKMSASQMGNSNGKNQPNSIKIEVTDLETNTKTIFNSISAAAKALNILQQTISVYFKRNQQKPIKGRYVFRYRKF